MDVVSPNGPHVFGGSVTPRAAVHLIEYWLKEGGFR